jgi:hypothetical protein
LVAFATADALAAGAGVNVLAEACWLTACELGAVAIPSNPAPAHPANPAFNPLVKFPVDNPTIPPVTRPALAATPIPVNPPKPPAPNNSGAK